MVTVVAPFLNEINFVRAWAKNVSKYADQVIVCDTGSKDGSREFLEGCNFTIIGHKVKTPYDWDEGWIRNRLIRYARNDWIVTQDLDELVSDEFIDFVKNLKTNKRFVRFPVYWFCHSLKTRKAKGHHSIRIIKNSPDVKYVGGNHCYLTYKGLPKGSARLSMLDSNIPIFHYHLFFPPKDGDNSKDDYLIDGEPLLSYLGEHPPEVKYL